MASFSKAAGKLRRRHLYISQNSTKRANFEWAIAVDWHGRSQIAARKKVVTSTHAKQLKALTLKELHDFLSGDASEAT
jgi:hypothetical protein